MFNRYYFVRKFRQGIFHSFLEFPLFTLLFSLFYFYFFVCLLLLLLLLLFFYVKCHQFVMWFLRTSEKSIVWLATKENLYISDSVWMKAESSKKGLAILYKGDTYFKGRH